MYASPSSSSDKSSSFLILKFFERLWIYFYRSCSSLLIVCPAGPNTVTFFPLNGPSAVIFLSLFLLTLETNAGCSSDSASEPKSLYAAFWKKSSSSEFYDCSSTLESSSCISFPSYLAILRAWAYSLSMATRSVLSFLETTSTVGAFRSP
jgi:hypothetical protein